MTRSILSSASALSCLVAALLGSCGAVDVDGDVGFHLMFQTDTRQVQDIPVPFLRPPPSWIRGTLIRNGLGRFGLGDRNFTHIFDAFAKLNSWRFDGTGNVFFSTRFVESNWYRDSLREQTVAPYLTFGGVEPPLSWTETLSALFHGIDNTDINVIQFGNGSSVGNDIATLSDFWHMYRVDGRTLETKGRVAPPIPGASIWSEYLPLPNPSSAHPVKEHGTNNYINYVLNINPFTGFNADLHLVRIKSLEERELVATINMNRIPYMHSFALSKNYAVIFANPLFVDIEKMLKTTQPGRSLDWEPETMTVVHAINIHTGEVRSFKTESAFVMHHVNAVEVEPGLIQMDAVVYPNIEFVTSLTLDKLLNPTTRNTIPVESKLKRYVLDLTKGVITVQEFPSQKGLEFVNKLDMPALNERYRQVPYCFVYGLVVKSDDVHLSNTSLVKKYLCGGGRDRSWNRANHYPSEPWFVARPGGRKEDDGVLVSVVLDGEKGRSYLGIWDAATMRLVNKGSIPMAIPFGLHGRFFD